MVFEKLHNLLKISGLNEKNTFQRFDTLKNMVLCVA